MSTVASRPEGVLRLSRRLWHDDSGQDLIEYALLSVFIGIVGVVAWAGISNALGQTYGAWDTQTQNLWVPPNPTVASP